MAVMDELEQAMKISRTHGDAPKQNDAARKETATQPKDTNIGIPQGNLMLSPRQSSTGLPAKPPVGDSPSKKRDDGLSADTRGPQPKRASGQERFRLLLGSTKAGPKPSNASGLDRLLTNPRAKHSSALPAREDSNNLIPTPVPQSGLGHRNSNNSGSAVALLPFVKTEPMESGQTFLPLASSQIRAADAHSGFGNQLPTAILSHECQLQGFNPQFTVSMNTDGKYMCRVDVNGISVVDQRSWPDPWQAKQEISAIALDNHVHGVGSSRGSIRGSGTNMTHTSAGNQRNELYCEQRLREDPRGPEGVDQQLQSEEARLEERLLLAQIRRLYGRYGDISNSMMEDPVASRAFLVGFSLGSTAVSTVVSGHQDQRRRSRSPLRGGDAHRDRVSSDNHRSNGGSHRAMRSDNR